MKRIKGVVGANRVELSIREEDRRKQVRTEAAMRFAASLLSQPSCSLPKERLIEVAIEYAEELVRQLVAKD